MRCRVDGEVVTLSCNYDVGGRVWDGRDSFDMPEAYQVQLNVSSSSNPIWALVSWIIEKLYH